MFFQELFHFQRPLTDNVWVFMLSMLIILLAPLAFKRLRIPGIVGLIISGMIVGPHGLNLMTREGNIGLFATVGLFYILFLAGLEIDLQGLKKQRNKSITYALAGFFIPIILGVIFAHFVLNPILLPEHSFTFTGTLIFSSVHAAQTLVAYPILVRLGISRRETVMITIGGTILIDTAVLLMFAILTNSARGTLSVLFLVKMLLSMSFFVGAVLWFIPKISRWFFKNIEGERGSQFIYVLAMVFFSGVLAEIAGIEPIIGAFLAGLALNRLIPPQSPLMNRIEFMGQTLFIPFFLLSIGMLMDWRILWKDNQVLLFCLGFVLIDIIGKYIAAITTRKLLRYSAVEGKLIWGLSSAHAATTIAVALTGIHLNLLPPACLDASVLLIMVSCVLSSILTDSAGRQYAMLQLDAIPAPIAIPQQILVPISHPDHIPSLLNLALLIKQPNSSENLYALSVVLEGGNTRDKIVQTKQLFKEKIQQLGVAEEKIELLTKVELNVASGIIRAVQENTITEVVMGWGMREGASEFMFGTVLEKIIQDVPQMLIISHLHYPIHTFEQARVLVSAHAEFEKGFILWVEMVARICKKSNLTVHFYGETDTLLRIRGILSKPQNTLNAYYQPYNSWGDFPHEAEKMKDDLYMIVAGRTFTVSFQNEIIELPDRLTRNHEKINFLLVYPEQHAMSDEELNYHLASLPIPPLQENFNRISRFGKWVQAFIQKNIRE